MIHLTHELYTADDFTAEEIERKNVIAVAVIADGLLCCKLCGDEGAELERVCETNRQRRIRDLVTKNHNRR